MARRRAPETRLKAKAPAGAMNAPKKTLTGIFAGYLGHLVRSPRAKKDG
jgi:hypothetical protein